MKTHHFSILALGMSLLLGTSCGQSGEEVAQGTTNDSTTTAVVADAPARLNVPRTTSDDPTLAPQPVTYPQGLEKALGRLEHFVAERDALGLQEMLAPDVMVNFMDGDPRMFMESWELTDPATAAQSEVWSLLTAIIAGKGAIVNEELGIYAFPQYYANWPERYDILDHALVNGENVNVRATPSADGQIVAQLSYELVKSSLTSPDAVYETIGGEKHPWIEIERVRDGLKGYVWGKYIATGYDYRLGMQAYDKSWKITYLIGGD